MTEQELIKILKQLKQVSLTPEEKGAGLVLFMQKVNDKFSQETIETASVQPETAKLGLATRLVAVRETMSEALVKSREVTALFLRAYSSHLVASVLITILVFGAFGVYSGISAQKALPDNQPLYTLKRALEKTQLTLSFSSTKRAETRVNFLARRVDELDRVVKATAENPDRDGDAVVSAINNTKQEIAAVKQDLSELAKNKNGDPSLNELKELVEGRVQWYQIALSEVHEGLPENIKEEVEPEVVALNSAIQEINEVIVGLDEGEVEGVADVNTDGAFDLEATTSEAFIIGEPASSTAVTTTEILVETATSATSSAEQATTSQDYAPKPVVKEKPFSIKEDTLKVHIGD